MTTPDLFTIMNMEHVKLPSFFNSTSETGATLKEYQSKAETQDAKVLETLKAMGSASPSQIWIAMGRDNAPLTSIRRAVTNLTKAGLAACTTEKRTGEFGRPEKVWKYVEQV